MNPALAIRWFRMCLIVWLMIASKISDLYERAPLAIWTKQRILRLNRTNLRRFPTGFC